MGEEERNWRAEFERMGETEVRRRLRNDAVDQFAEPVRGYASRWRDYVQGSAEARQHALTVQQTEIQRKAAEASEGAVLEARTANALAREATDAARDAAASAREANKLARESNDVAASSRDLARQANSIARDASESALNANSLARSANAIASGASRKMTMTNAIAVISAIVAAISMVVAIIALQEGA